MLHIVKNFNEILVSDLLRLFNSLFFGEVMAIDPEFLCFLERIK
jgi:hypothetical protein